ncbi:MAG: hypothetical protein AABX03_03755 [Nanoarchaeota archaeon]
MSSENQYNTEVVSFMIDPIEIVGYCPSMNEMIFMDAVTLLGNHVVSVPVMKYTPWMSGYYARVE